jgi:hypothetical protein
MMNKVYSLIALAILFVFSGFLAPKSVFAQAFPPQNGPYGPQIYGDPMASFGQYPVTYSPSNTPPYSAPLPYIDYSHPTIPPQLPIVYGQAGQVGPNPESTSAPIPADNGSIFGTIFGRNKVSATSTIKADLTEELNSKGLALGTTSGSMCAKDTIEYLVLFKNINKDTITNVAIRVYLPQSIVFTRSTQGVYSLYDNTVTVFIGTLLPGATGEFMVDGTVSNTAPTSAARAEMVYTLNQTQNMVTSYAFQTDDTCTNSRLAGYAGGAGFFPTTLIGWIVLSIIACAIIYFTRFFKKKKEEERLRMHPVHAH